MQFNVIFHAFDECDRKALLDYETTHRILRMLSMHHISNNKCINHIEKHRLTMLIQGFIFQSSRSKTMCNDL
jgi:hypothetical protein